VWLFGSGLLGLIGVARRTHKRDYCLYKESVMSKEGRSRWLGCLLMLAGILGTAQARADLFVGNFFSPDLNVLRYDGTTGAFVGVFVPTGSGGLSFPLGGSFGPDGNFYVSNSDADNVLRYDGTTGAFIDEFVPGGTEGPEDAAGLVFRGGFLHVANSADPGAVTRYNAATGAPAGPFVTPGSGGLSNPEGLTFGPDGNLYVTTDGGGVRRYNGVTGAFIDTVVPTGTLLSARGLTFGPDGNLYVTNFGGGTVARFDGTTWAFIDNFVTAGSGGLGTLPRPLSFGPDGNLYVGDYSNGSVLRYDGTTGAFIDAFVSAGGALGGPTFLVFNGAAPPVPIPAAAWLFGSGLLGLIGVARRKRTGLSSKK
jgi:streptogramin lyase